VGLEEYLEEYETNRLVRWKSNAESFFKKQKHLLSAATLGGLVYGHGQLSSYRAALDFTTSRELFIDRMQYGTEVYVGCMMLAGCGLELGWNLFSKKASKSSFHMSHKGICAAAYGAAGVIGSTLIPMMHSAPSTWYELLPRAIAMGGSAAISAELLLSSLSCVKPNRLKNLPKFALKTAQLLTSKGEKKREIAKELSSISQPRLARTLDINSFSDLEIQQDEKDLIVVSKAIEHLGEPSIHEDGFFVKMFYEAQLPLMQLVNTAHEKSEPLVPVTFNARRNFKIGKYTDLFTDLDRIIELTPFPIELSCMVAEYHALFCKKIEEDPESFSRKGLSILLEAYDHREEPQRRMRDAFISALTESDQDTMQGNTVTVGSSEFLFEYVFHQDSMAGCRGREHMNKSLQEHSHHRIRIEDNVALLDLQDIEHERIVEEGCLVTKHIHGTSFWDVEDIGQYEEAIKGIGFFNNLEHSRKGTRYFTDITDVLTANGFSDLAKKKKYIQMCAVAHCERVMSMDAHGGNFILSPEGVVKIDNEERAYDTGYFDILKLWIHSGLKGNLDHLPSLVSWYCDGSMRNQMHVLVATCAGANLMAFRHIGLSGQGRIHSIGQRQIELESTMKLNEQVGDWKVFNPYLRQMLDATQ